MPRTLFAPAVALLDRLDFRHKFLLVGVLILLPLAYLLLDLALDMADSLDTTRRELQGVALLRELTPIILATQRHRGYINAHLGGSPGALERARQAAGAVEAGLGRLAGHLGQDWLDERARRRQAALADEWRRLAATAAGMRGADSFQVHNALIGGWLEFAIETADAAGLTLDAGRATYYLQDTLQRALLPLMEETARLRGQTAGLLARKDASADERAELAARLEAVRIAARQTRLNLDKVFATDADSGTVLGPRLAEMENHLARLAETSRAQVLGGAFAISGLDYFAQASHVLDRQRLLYEAGLERLDEALTRRLDDIAIRQALTLAGGGALVGIALYFAIAIALSITRAVRGIESMTGALARGELGARLATTSRDELGRIATGLNGAAEGLSALVGEVRQAIDAWNEAAEALSSGAGEIAQAVIEQNNDSAASAAAVQELAVSIAHVAEQTRHTHELARESGALAERGGQEAATASEEMAAIAAAVRDTASQIEALDARVRDIESIARGIKEIAKQTDLLALNAAIEAARAGEAGRGFTVVADEVRKLAERTTAATGEIDALLGLIDRQTRAAIDAMHDNAARVTGGTEQSARTAALLARIQHAFGEVVGRVDEIAHASREQEAASVDLARNMERIAQANERNGIQARQVSAFTEHLRDTTETIRARLQRFSL